MKVFVVGVGNWGVRLVERFIKLGCEVGICDTSKEALERTRQRFPLISNFGFMHNWDNFDAVVVATPPSTHYGLAKLSLEAGKHTLVEKPLTLDFKQAAGLYELARNKGITLMADDTFMYTDFVRDYRLIATPIQSLQALWTGYRSPDPSVPEEGILWTLGPHPISLMLHFMQQLPFDMVGNIRPKSANILYQFPGGAEANIILNWETPLRKRSISLLEARSSVLVDFDTAKQDPDPLTVMCKRFIERCSAAYFLDDRALDVVDVLQATHAKLYSAKQYR